MGAQRVLMQGREAAGRLAWADAYTALSLADRSSSLAGEDLELLATAAYLLGRVETACGRCSAPSSSTPSAATSGGPHGARSGWPSA